MSFNGFGWTLCLDHEQPKAKTLKFKMKMEKKREKIKILNDETP